MGIGYRDIEDVRLITELRVRFPHIEPVHAEQTLNQFHEAFNPDLPWNVRLSNFIVGDSNLSSVIGILLDVITVFLPYRVTTGREAVRRILNRKKRQEMKMATIKNKLKNASFWEGIAAIAGAIGITINPAAIVEIVTGVFVIWGGIEMWKDE